MFSLGVLRRGLAELLHDGVVGPSQLISSQPGSSSKPFLGLVRLSGLVMRAGSYSCMMPAAPLAQICRCRAGCRGCSVSSTTVPSTTWALIEQLLKHMLQVVGTHVPPRHRRRWAPARCWRGRWPRPRLCSRRIRQGRPPEPWRRPPLRTRGA